MSNDQQAVEKRCIAFVGSGGKTSSIYSCIRQFLLKENGHKEQEKDKNFSYADDFSLDHLGIEAGRMLVFTTTKMFVPEKEWEKYNAVNGSLEEKIRKLREKKVCITGIKTERNPLKMGPISEEEYEILYHHADRILIEADGSNHMPLKYPADWEPVYPKDITDIVITVGLSALGKPLGQVCHREELARNILHCDLEKKVRADDIYKLIKKGYIDPANHVKHTHIYCLLNQADTVEDKSELRDLKQMIRETGISGVFTGYFDNFKSNISLMYEP